ncbi:Pre-mRNA splicing, partial [Coemansia erecta]
AGDAAAALRRVAAAHVVLATPRAWDALSRRWRQRQRAAVRDVGLVVADHVHWVGGAALGSSSSAADELLAGGDVAGDRLAATYEAVISRVRLMAAQLARDIRIVGLAAPVANARDLALWLGAPAGPQQQGILNFAPAVRAVPLELRFETSAVPHAADRLAAWLPTVYRTAAAAESAASTLVFVPSRRQARMVAADLADRVAEADMGTLASPAAPPDAPPPVADAALAGLLPLGVAVLHEALSPADRRTVLELFACGRVGVVVATRTCCWALGGVRARSVVVLGTERYCAREQRHVDYAVPDVLQMLGRAGRPGVDSAASAVVMCHASKRAIYRRFALEPLPVESRLDAQLHDVLNAEIAARAVGSKQDAVDYLTWTLLYRRLLANPHYYGVAGVEPRHLSEFLSELVERTAADLVAARCVEYADADELELAPTNLGMIAAYYAVRHVTVEMFALSLSARTKLRGVLDILAAADEFDALPLRTHDADALARLAQRLPVPVPSVAAAAADSADATRMRAHVLLQAHFERLQLPVDLAADQAWVVSRAPLLLQALVDVASSLGLLAPALAAMELSQMVVQAVWEGRDPLVRQIPHLAAPPMAQRCVEQGVASVFDVIDMDDEPRAQLLAPLAPAQVADVARYVNRYPNIEVEHSVRGDVHAAGSVAVRLVMDREWDDDDEEDDESEGKSRASAELGPVIAPFFPAMRSEAWWVVVARGSDELLTLKRVSVGRQATVDVEFAAPDAPGPASVKIFVMCDSYLGCDQEFDLDFNVLEAESSESEDEDDDDDDDNAMDED